MARSGLDDEESQSAVAVDAEVVEWIRQKRGWTHDDLARRALVHPDTALEFSSGRLRSPWVAQWMSRALGVDIGLIAVSRCTLAARKLTRARLTDRTGEQQDPEGA